MPEDPKYTIKQIVDDITLLKDDEVTDAALIFLYHGGPETLKELFADYDVVVTFSDARASSTRLMHSVPEHHPEVYPVHVLTIDKYVAGVLVCTAEKMQHKMKEQMRSVIEAAAKSTTYRLTITGETPSNKRVGGLDLWETTYSILYTDV